MEPGTHIIDDEVAGYMGAYTLALASARQARTLQMFGPPHSTLQVSFSFSNFEFVNLGADKKTHT